VMTARTKRCIAGAGMLVTVAASACPAAWTPVQAINGTASTATRDSGTTRKSLWH